MTLQLVGIHAEYDGRPLYRNLSLTVDTGEIVSLVGPSGSGKSTLLRIIAGIEQAKKGRVVLNDRDITALPIHRRGIGMVFQDNQLFPHLDVAHNIGYGLRMNRGSSSASVAEMLELIGLSDFGTRRVDTLSG
ncbi:MAG: ABC transporter ATP-binding protein, partial [Actinobacteria bacterium]|nr:ABC transporter ATP-binding protein [Actinomycetota bacterium]